MIEKLLKTILLTVFVVVALGEAPGYAQGARAIEGTWTTTTVLTDCRTGQVLQTFPKMISFHMGGTANEASASNAGFLRTASFGGWRHLNDNVFRYETKALRFNADNTYAGPFRVIYEVESLGDTYRARGMAEVSLPNGIIVATFCTSETGTRLVVF